MTDDQWPMTEGRGQGARPLATDHQPPVIGHRPSSGPTKPWHLERFGVPPSREEGYNPDHQEQQENDLGDVGGDSRQCAKAQDRRHEGDDQAMSMPSSTWPDPPYVEELRFHFHA
jgi:hypothetical protein